MCKGGDDNDNTDNDSDANNGNVNDKTDHNNGNVRDSAGKRVVVSE